MKYIYKQDVVCHGNIEAVLGIHISILRIPKQARFTALFKEGYHQGSSTVASPCNDVPSSRDWTASKPWQCSCCISRGGLHSSSSEACRAPALLRTARRSRFPGPPATSVPTRLAWRSFAPEVISPLFAARQG